MSALEEAIKDTSVNLSEKTKTSLLSNFIDLISSVRFGIILLILLILLCLLGMLVMQYNVKGFDVYFAELTASKQIIYGSLGFFDIYHSWYFNLLLVLLSINIILASADRFPKTWTFISKPKTYASIQRLRKQKPNGVITLHGTKEKVIEAIVGNCKTSGWQKINVGKKNGDTIIFAESGAWNRLGAYPVHFALLTILFGGFLTSQLSFTGEMPLTFGQISNQITENNFVNGQFSHINTTLPFTVKCTDLEQKLIDKNGSIDTKNTFDWLTYIEIEDEFGKLSAVVRLNRPFDYRGYRFFHSSSLPIGMARSVSIRITSENQTQELTMKRDETQTLADGTNIRFVDFRANFSLLKENPNETSTKYQNPAAILEVTTPNGSPQTIYAFSEQIKNNPIAEKNLTDYKFQMSGFEKVSEQHTLFVQRDPGANIVYIGFILLFLSLAAVFLFSHQRVWSVVEEISETAFNVTIGGNTNRNQTAFDEKFKRFINDL